VDKVIKPAQINMQRVNELVEEAAKLLLEDKNSLKYLTPKEVVHCANEYILSAMFDSAMRGRLYCHIVQAALTKMGCEQLDEEGIYKFLTSFPVVSN
jgi:hypothetical protein